MTTRKWYMKSLMLLFSLAIFTTTSLGNSIANASINDAEREKFNNASQASIESVLNELTSIPDEILNTNDADTINNYLISKGSSLRVTDSNQVSPPTQSSNKITTNGAWDCGIAIAGVLVTTAVPVTKIVKITKLVKSLGGAAEAAKIIWGASFASEKWAALGGAAKDLVAELAGITAIKKSCGL